MAKKRTARRRAPIHANTLSVTLSELGHKDERFDSLEDALAELHARYPRAKVGNWSKPKVHHDYGETLSWIGAKWGETYKPRATGKYDGKITRYFTGETDPADRLAVNRKFGWR